MSETIPTGTWVIDPSHSDVTFSVRHLMISKVKGNFGAFNGTITTGDTIAGSQVDAKIDVTTIDTKDEGRNGHLRSPDFFAVDEHPEITFVSTSVEPGKHDKFQLHGDLTIRGTTKPVVLDVELGGVAKDGYGQTKLAAEASTTISRGDFGLTWNSALESGGVLVSDEVAIQLDVQAVLQA